MIHTLILPGFHNSDPEHWQSRWEAGHENMFRVIQDDWVTPRCADWVSKLDEALAACLSDECLAFVYCLDKRDYKRSETPKKWNLCVSLFLKSS